MSVMKISTNWFVNMDKNVNRSFKLKKNLKSDKLMTEKKNVRVFIVSFKIKVNITLTDKFRTISLCQPSLAPWGTVQWSVFGEHSQHVQ